MATIWSKRGGEWRVLRPVPFEDEAALQGLIAEAPQLLPLAGSPELIVLGSEVWLGNGTADLLAVDPEGRLAIIELKLAKNAEARRAVVSQTLAYAAYLRGLSVADLETLLSTHLAGSLAEHIQERDESGAFDPDDVRDGLASYLESGFFRLVIVLDDVPTELERIVGYLEAVSRDGLLIDLIRVQSYDVGGERIIVPTRVEPGREPPAAAVPQHTTTAWRPRPVTTEGTGVFRGVVARQAPELADTTEQLLKWAEGLQSEGVATLVSVEGRSNRLLRICLPDSDVKPILVWCYTDQVTVAVKSYVRDWLPPDSADRFETLNEQYARVPPSATYWDWDISDITPELLDILATAYRTAAQNEA